VGALVAELVAKTQEGVGGVLARACGRELELALLAAPQTVDALVEELVDIAGDLAVGVPA